MDISELRAEINKIDEELVRLFCERMFVCAGVAKYKAQHGLDVYDAEREQAVLEGVLSKADDELSPYVRELYLRIFELSREYQSMING
jgi:chorismate mutase/prephenate dehydratase